jgi:RNA polymerase sigma factor (sigma-70 family)
MRFFYARFSDPLHWASKKEEINMIKKFQTQDAEITIEITEQGKAIYAVGKKKTTFDLSKCESFTYWSVMEREKFVVTEDMLTGADEIEPWVWLVISRGEDRLEYNNDQAETRSHQSYSSQNDKAKDLVSDEDAFEEVLANLGREAVRKAIRSLEPKQQELIFDIYYRGLSKADVAKRDGVSKMAITNRMNKIINRLKKYLINL